MWHVGQRVVCVDDLFEDIYDEETPKRGVVYTIRGIKFWTVDKLSFTLEEITNPLKLYKEGVSEKHFRETRFKPIDEKRLDIFREMLTVKEREKEIHQ